MYLVKWKNSEETTWEPRQNLDNCPQILENFKKQQSIYVAIKDMQKELPLPKLFPQPSDYYRKVKYISLNPVIIPLTPHCFLSDKYSLITQTLATYVICRRIILT
jgi:hypothetical protein